MTTDSLDITASTEPWMRGTHTGLDALRRGVIHALELSMEDVDRWAENLSESALEAQPAGLPSVAFHLRHIARSLDRLLTYAEDRQLDESQLALLNTEAKSTSFAGAIEEFRDGVTVAMQRILRLAVEQLEEPRGIGRQRLPTTVGGLLAHCGEHTQRHSGQLVTTAKLVTADTVLCNDNDAC